MTILRRKTAWSCPYGRAQCTGNIEVTGFVVELSGEDIPVKTVGEYLKLVGSFEIRTFGLLVQRILFQTFYFHIAGHRNQSGSRHENYSVIHVRKS